MHGVTIGEDVVDKLGGGFPMRTTMYADMSMDVAMRP